MPPRDWRLRVEDILQAIRKIQRLTGGTTLEKFSADEKTMDAVAYDLTAVGVATRHIPDDILVRYGEIPWAKVRAIRNLTTHEYFRVSPPIVWDTAQRNLPAMAEVLERMLFEHP